MPEQIYISPNGQDSTQETIHLRSSEVDEVLSQPPTWLIQWGITIFSLVLLVVGFVGWFIKYPDLVRGNLIIVADEFPKSVNTRTDGKLEQLLVKEGEIVAKHQHLAYTESTANVAEVLSLEMGIDSLIQITKRHNFEDLYAVNISPYFQLGELQKSFQMFQETYIQGKALLKGGTYDKKQIALQNDLMQLSILEDNLSTQLINHRSDLSLAESDLEMNRKLHKERVVADVDVRRSQSVFIAKKQVLDQAQTTFNNNKMAQNQKYQELLELSKIREEQKNKLLQVISTLKSDIEAWKYKFVVISPADGKVSFVTPLQEGQTMKTGQDIFYIISKKDSFHGEMHIGQYNLGKVKSKQNVIIKLPSYPFQEFGTITGQINSISELPKDSTYLVKIIFPKGLITSSNKKIPFRNSMSATGEIVTEDLRLIERLFYDIKKALTQ